MTWLWVAVVVAVLGVAIALVVGRIGGGEMAEVAPDRPAAQLSSAPLTDADLAGIRFTQTLRGYAMDEVDDFIERLRAELSARPAADTFAIPAEASAAPAAPAAPWPSVDEVPLQPAEQSLQPAEQSLQPAAVDGDPQP